MFFDLFYPRPPKPTFDLFLTYFKVFGVSGPLGRLLLHNIKTRQSVHPRTLVAFVIETMNGIIQYYRAIGSIWDSRYSKRQLRDSDITLDQVYNMRSDFLIELKLNEEQEKITQIVTGGSGTQMKPSAHDEYINVSKGKVQQKGKGRGGEGKGGKQNWHLPSNDYWKASGSLKIASMVTIAQDIIPDDNQEDVRFVDLLDTKLLNAPDQSSRKRRMPSMTTTLGEEQWSHPPTYYLNYDDTRTGTDYHQVMEQARHAHLEAAARWEDQREQQRRQEAEREWREREATTQRWEAQVRQACYHATHLLPAGQPPVAIQTEAQPQALPHVHGALRANDPKAPTTQPSIAKKPPPSQGRPLPKGFFTGDAPPMIGTMGPIQSPPPAGLPTSTPMTPAHSRTQTRRSNSSTPNNQASSTTTSSGRSIDQADSHKVLSKRSRW